MKIDDLFETTTTGMTSVASIGKLEYTGKPHQIKLYKRNKEGMPKCIARIRRKTGKGWRFEPTKCWESMGLEHFGNAFYNNTFMRGQKTHTKNIENILKHFGIRYDEIHELNE